MAPHDHPFPTYPGKLTESKLSNAKGVAGVGTSTCTTGYRRRRRQAKIAHTSLGWVGLMQNFWRKLASWFATHAMSAHTALTLPPQGAPAARVLARAVAPAELHGRPTGIAAAVSYALFILLIVVNVIRTLRHAMWRDELHSFMLALDSSSLWSLLLKLKYFGHPGLWYILVWVVTRVTSDPTWMQVMHIGLAIGVWIIIYWWSPFSRLEKILLLLSYFLFWEYFVISRNYVLIALTAFAFIALRERQPRLEFILWLLLGLLANVHVFGAIWSMVLAAMLAMEGIRRRSASVAGAAVYLILLVFAIATMLPAADFSAHRAVGFSVSGFDLTVPFGAFVPLRPHLIWDAIEFIAHPETANIPQFWNSNPVGGFVALAHADTNHPVRLALVFAVPIAACWLIARDPLLVLEFALVYLGILLFQNIWDFPGRARHHGVVFLASIGTAWTARLRHSPAIWSSWVLGALLIVNACGGVLTLASELRPFSEGYNAAAWIKQNDLADTFLIGSRDAQTSTVAGYLGRPIYYLECECRGTFVVWNDKRFQSLLSPEEFGRRLTKAVALAGQHDAILIRNRPVTVEELTSGAPNLSVALLKSFTDAPIDENFWIYRVSEKQPP
jgi:hypothetical protein